MARVKWAEDYGQYKEGKEFDLEGPGLAYLLKTEKVTLVEESDSKARLAAEPDPELQETPETAALAQAENAAEKTAKKGK